MINFLKTVTIVTLLLAPGAVGYYFHETVMGPISLLITLVISVTTLLYLKQRWNLYIDSRIRDEHKW